MPFTLTMPKLSPTMEEGTVAKWHKKEGEHVEAGDLLIEVSTDKATVEHNALDAGWLRKIIINEGQEAIVNQPIAIFTEEKDESIEGYQPEGDQPAVPEVSPAPNEVDRDEGSTQPQSTKPSAAPQQQPRPSAGALQSPAFAPEAPIQQKPTPAASVASSERRIASPLARKLAKERGLDLSTVKGSGPGGRIMSRDLANAQPHATFAFGRRDLPQLPSGTYKEEPLTPMRKVISQRLQESKTFIPHFYVQQTIDAEPLTQFRQQLLNLDLKVSFNDCIIRAAALALRQHSVVNSGFYAGNQTTLRYQTIDISVAVSLPDGLITPIIRYADFKNLGEIAAEMKTLAKKAREGKLEPQEYKGGSFTVSNLGMFGVTNFQAIINPPQAGILAISGINDVPVVKEGKVVPGKVMNLTLSVDHRVVDGVAAAEFLKTVQKLLENPAALLL